MRRYASPPAGENPHSVTDKPRSERDTLARLWPYLWAYKGRVMLALAFMVGAKLANVGVPLLLKELVDSLSPKLGMGPGSAAAMLVLPLEQAVSEKLARVEGSAVAARSLPRMFDLSDRRRV